jgi:hypothetical protein
MLGACMLGNHKRSYSFLVYFFAERAAGCMFAMNRNNSDYVTSMVSAVLDVEHKM